MPQHCTLLLITYLYLSTLDMARGQSVFLSNICKSVDPRSFSSDHHYRMSNYSKSPFYLIQSSNHYEPHRPILVELGGASFRGFLLVAVDPLTGTRIGKWMMARGTSLLPCSAIIHSDYRIKKHALFMWQPPASTSNGYVAFEATILDADNRFIVGQVSVLPHQLYTHYQMNPVYERISPLEGTKTPTSSSINPSALFSVGNKQHQSSLASTATGRQQTLGDILAQGSHITSSAILGQNSGENGETRRDWEGMLKTVSSVEKQSSKCDQQQPPDALLPSAGLEADKHLFQFFAA